VLIRLPVNAIIFLAPISTFDQVLAEVSCFYPEGDSRLNRFEGPPRESPGRFPAVVEIHRLQQTAMQRQHSVVLEQVRLTAGLFLPLFPDTIVLIPRRPSWMPVYDSTSIWFLMVTDPMITTPFQIVCFFLCCPRPRFHFHSDFRNKFGALHQSYTPNRERELYGEPFAFEIRQWHPAESMTVHLTSVTDTRRTHTIISSGKFTPHSAGLFMPTYGALT